MTPVERYRHLEQFWKKQIEEARAQLEEASQNHQLFYNKLVAAEIAEKLANEE